MRSVRYTLIVAAVICAADAPYVGAQSNSKEIMAQSPAQLVDILKNPDAAIFEKAKACQRLAVVGTSDAIPALAALLSDEKLNVYARCGLEGIPDPAVDEALRNAAQKLQGGQLVGVLDSIGRRKDTRAIELLRGLLRNSDPEVASAAAGALGQIGTSEAAAILKEAVGQNMPVEGWIAYGCLACANRLVAGDKKEEALALYKAVEKANVQKHIQAAAIQEQLRLQKAEAKDLLVAQIRNPDATFFNAGLAAARDIPGAEVTAALAGEVEQLPAERQALLLRAIGDRKEPAPLPMLIAASQSPSSAVQRAAIGVLAKRGDVQAAVIGPSATRRPPGWPKRGLEQDFRARRWTPRLPPGLQTPPPSGKWFSSSSLAPAGLPRRCRRCVTH